VLIAWGNTWGNKWVESLGPEADKTPDFWSTILEITTSEFFWGIVIGVVLSISGAYFGTRFAAKAQNAELRKRQIDFCNELLDNITGLVGELEDHRNRSQVIHRDFLDLIDVEIGIYARNRENLVLLPR